MFVCSVSVYWCRDQIIAGKYLQGAGLEPDLTGFIEKASNRSAKLTLEVLVNEEQKQV